MSMKPRKQKKREENDLVQNLIHRLALIRALIAVLKNQYDHFMMKKTFPWSKLNRFRFRQYRAYDHEQTL